MLSHFFSVHHTSLYSGITNQNGVANYSLSNLQGIVTFTASYSNITSSCTVSGHIFVDDCSSDNTSNYSFIQVRQSNPSGSIIYDAQEQAYHVNSGNSLTIIQFGNTVLQDGMKISCDIKLIDGNSWRTNGVIGFRDKDDVNLAIIGYAQGQNYYRIMEINSNSELQTTPNHTWSELSTNDYNHHELIYRNGIVTYTITNPQGTSKTLTLTPQNSNYIGGPVGLFLDSTNSNYCYIKNIIVDSVGGG